MNARTKALIASGAVAAAAIAGTAVAAAGGDDDHEAPITGSALDRATAAALAHTGEGQVTETEVGDEDSYYEVEVTLEDGSRIDVQLDRDFQVVSDEVDGPGDGEDD